MNKIQPLPVVKINCPSCGELQLKIYPWSSITFKPDARGIPPCQKCVAKHIKNNRLGVGVAQ